MPQERENKSCHALSPSSSSSPLAHPHLQVLNTERDWNEKTEPRDCFYILVTCVVCFYLHFDMLFCTEDEMCKTRRSACCVECVQIITFICTAHS